MEYAVYNTITGEIQQYGSRPDSDPFVLEDTTQPLEVLTDAIGVSHDYYVDVKTKALKAKPPRPDGVVTFNYYTKQWDIDKIESVRMARANEYPSIGDQLDSLWKVIKSNANKFDLTEAQSVFDAVQEVKAKYPKEI